MVSNCIIWWWAKKKRPHRENWVNHTILPMCPDFFCPPLYYVVWNHPFLFGKLYGKLAEIRWAETVHCTLHKCVTNIRCCIHEYQSGYLYSSSPFFCQPKYICICICPFYSNQIYLYLYLPCFVNPNIFVFVKKY